MDRIKTKRNSIIDVGANLSNALYKDYTKKYLNKILASVFFGILVAASTSSIAWLLDPAIKKIFIEKDQSLIFIIPLMIILAFTNPRIYFIQDAPLLRFSSNDFFNKNSI